MFDLLRVAAESPPTNYWILKDDVTTKRATAGMWQTTINWLNEYHQNKFVLRSEVYNDCKKRGTLPDTDCRHLNSLFNARIRPERPRLELTLRSRLGPTGSFPRIVYAKVTWQK